MFLAQTEALLEFLPRFLKKGIRPRDSLALVAVTKEVLPQVLVFFSKFGGCHLRWRRVTFLAIASCFPRDDSVLRFQRSGIGSFETNVLREEGQGLSQGELGVHEP